MEKDNQEEQYKGLKEKLEQAHEFPGEYTYKFILPNDNKKIAEIQQLFDKNNPQYSFKNSKNAKYVSVTVQAYLLDADAVLHYYKEVGKIKGVMML